MKGFIVRSLAIAGLAGCMAGSIGCVSAVNRYREIVDPCWPERYNAVARDEVIAAFGPQVQNGHILDRTIWPYHFEAGTDILTRGGQEKLDELVRRRPQPDQRLFLATARDIYFDLSKADEYVKKRQELDAKRVAAIQKYLAVQTASRPMEFEVLVHDPSDQNLPAVGISNAILNWRLQFQGSRQGTAFGGPGGAQIGGMMMVSPQSQAGAGQPGPGGGGAGNPGQ